MNSEIDSSASQATNKSANVDKKRMKSHYGQMNRRGSYLQSGGVLNDTNGVTKIALQSKEQVLKENDPIKTLNWRISRHRIEIDTLHRTIGKTNASILEFSEKYSTASEFASLNETLKAVQEQLTRLDKKVEKNTYLRRSIRARDKPKSLGRKWIETPTLEDMVKKDKAKDGEAPKDDEAPKDGEAPKNGVIEKEVAELKAAVVQPEAPVAERVDHVERDKELIPVKPAEVQKPNTLHDLLETSSNDGKEEVEDVQDETGSILNKESLVAD